MNRPKFPRLIVLFIATILARINILHNKFIMDDFDYVVNWPLIKDWHNFPKFFVGYVPPVGQEGVYSPLKTFFHACSYHLFQVDPFGHHVLSILIHCAGVYWVYRIAQKLTSDHYLSFLAGLIFSLHPVQVEATSYITASIDMIGIVFMFISVLHYMQFSLGEKNSNIHYAVSLVFALLAFWTHELALSLPLLLTWHDLCLRKEKLTWRHFFRRLFPFFILAGVYVAAKWCVLGSVSRGGYLYGSFYLSMMVSLKVLAKYFTLIMFPLTLTHDHVISKGIFSFGYDDFDRFAVLSQSIFDLQTALSAGSLAIAVFLIIKNLKSHPVLAFCGGWFLITLIPVLNFIPSSVFFAERYLYPGMLGVSLLFAYGFDALDRSQRPMLKIPVRVWSVAILIAVLGFYFVRTWLRNEDWKDEVAFYKSAVKSNPDSALMRTELGLVLTKDRDFGQAITSFEQALKIRPDDPETYFAMAEAYIELQDNRKALSLLLHAVELDPGYSDAYYNLAGLYMLLGQRELAKDNLQKALYLYRQAGREQQAERFEKAFYDYFGDHST